MRFFNSFLNNFRGLNVYKIQAIELGLTPDQLKGHSWDDKYIRNVCQGSATLDYLLKRPDAISVSEAMDQIRGLNAYQIFAMSFGLKRNQLQGHNWDNEHGTGFQAEINLEYLRNRPDNVFVQQAMNNIRGFNVREIRSMINAQKRGIMSLNLTIEQVYICEFNETHYDRIAEGEAYEVVCPEGHKAILEMKKLKQEYAIGAASSALYLMAKGNNKEGIALTDPGSIIASNLTFEEAKMLSQTSRKIYNNALSFVRGAKKNKPQR